MPLYEYTARSQTGQILKGSLEAASREEVIGHIRKQKMTMVSMREAPKQIRLPKRPPAMRK